MTLQLAPGWHMDLEHGPEWLFVRLAPPEDLFADSVDLAGALWNFLEQEFTFRLVLELDQLPLLTSHLVGQLLRLSKRIYSHGGMLRICGLSDSNQQVLRISQLAGKFSQYRDRHDAVMGHRPKNPR